MRLTISQRWLAAGLALLGGAAVVLADEVVVQQGDTLSELAAAHGVSVQALMDANGLVDADRISEGLVLQLPPDPSEPVRYTVESGDRLVSIAERYGVSVKQLVAVNALTDPDALRVGQELLIPRGDGARPTLPDAVRRALDGIRPRRGWTHVVIHHSATEQGSVEDMDRYHRERRRMVNGLGYHFVIGNGQGMADGEIGIGPRWRKQLNGGHVADERQNQYSIGICLVGNFEESRPTARQLDQLEALVRYLQRRCRIPTSRVTTHTRINVRPTICPGRNFSLETFRQRLKSEE
jgi:LysM repeat protein